MAKLSYDFFLPHSKSDRDFGKELKAFAQMTHIDRRIGDGSHWFDLGGLTNHNDGTTTALIQRNRMLNLPPSGDSRNGKLNQMGLAEHLGVAEVSACLFDPKLNALCVQRSRYGISHATVKKLLNSATEADFVLEPVLSEDAMARLVHLQDAEKLTVKFATPRSPDYYTDAGGGIGDLAKFMKRQAATVVTVAVTPESKGGKLSLQGVRELISAAVGLVSDDDSFRLKALSVKGGNDDGDIELVDFINARFQAQAQMEDSNARHADPEHLRSQIRAAYREQRKYIQLYSSQAAAAQAVAGS